MKKYPHLLVVYFNKIYTIGLLFITFEFLFISGSSVNIVQIRKRLSWCKSYMKIDAICGLMLYFPMKRVLNYIPDEDNMFVDQLDNGFITFIQLKT